MRQRSVKLAGLTALLVLFGSGGAAAPLTAELAGLVNGYQVIDIDPENSPYNFSVTKTELSLSKLNPGLFSSIAGTRSVELENRAVFPGDRVEVCADVQLDSDSLSDGTRVYGYHLYASINSLSDSEETALGTGSPADGDDVVYVVGRYTEVCHSFEAPQQSGDYSLNVWTDVGIGGTFLGEQTLTVFADQDGDRVPDHEDACPETAGDDDFNGCPDSDGDDIKDGDDDCPQQPGITELNGCPNTEPQAGEIQVRDTALVNETIAAQISATDADGHSLSYSWSNGDSGSETSFTFKTTGSKTVTVEVTDGYTTVTGSATVDVVPNESGSADPGDGNETGHGNETGDDDDGETQPRTELGLFQKIFFRIVDAIGGVL